ncbi:MAG: hypothetical protein R3204_05655, partial [Oceanospirillum sp.]|nr:hypothetical protein [Oceanospirillum sp.]
MNSTPNPSQESASQIYRRLLSYVKPYSAAFMMSVFGYMLYAAASTAFAELMRYLIDTVEKGDA